MRFRPISWTIERLLDVLPVESFVTSLPPRWRATRHGTAVVCAFARRSIGRRRFDEADALLSEEIGRHPGRPRLLVAFAFSAHDRGAFEEALARWTRAREAGAPEALCLSCLAANNRGLGRLAVARTLIEESLSRYPDDLMTLTEAARLARDTNRPSDAEGYWHRALMRAKPHPDWLQGYAQSIFAQGDVERADKILASARRRFPDHRGLLGAQGALLVTRQRWPEAAAFWTDYRRRYPDDATGWEQLGIATQGARLSHAADAQEVAPLLADIAVVEDEPMRKLVMRFESLGDSCEMGLVQRRYGAEPLSLLRWNDVGLENLITALDQRFEGMGEPEHTAMMTAANGEFYVTDRRWSLTMHTFLFASHIDADDVYKKMCRRIVYLRGKLLEDIAAAEKIFVYHSSTIDADGLRRLHRALRAHGPVVLLGVQPVLTTVTAFPGRPVGEIEQLGEGLYVGFLAHPGTHVSGWNIAFETWTGLFAKVLEMTRGHAPGQTGADVDGITA